MAKKVTGSVKLQIPAGKATPAPPVGTALGPQGVNIMEFCKAFNAKTSAKDQEGLIIPVVITIFSDRSFTFITKTPPVPVLIKRAVSIAKGSAEPNKNKVGKITEAQVEEIAKIKMPDLNCFDVAAAVRQREGHGPQHGRRHRLELYNFTIRLGLNARPGDPGSSFLCLYPALAASNDRLYLIVDFQEACYMTTATQSALQPQLDAARAQTDELLRSA